MAKFDPAAFLASLTARPGIYEMLDVKGEVLYVGKAKNLKKRVASYFQRRLADTKTLALIEQVNNVVVTITNNENEALLLEDNLIKKFKPRYNVLLKDDKSYPYLFLSAHPQFPRLDIHRGPKRQKGRYFGPFPSVGAVRETLTLLQKIFKIRQCSDNFFSLRIRPCLQFYIQRCTAPCVSYITPEDYQRNVHYVELFLDGKNNEVIEELASKMDKAALNLDYEAAARFRDQVVSLRRVQEKQYMMGGSGDIDLVAAVQKLGVVCIQVQSIRNGRFLGGKSFFPAVPPNTNLNEVLAAFLPQYYLDTARGEVIPEMIILNAKLTETDWISNALSQQLGHKIQITERARGKAKQWLELATTNAQHSLHRHLADKVSYYQRFETLQTELQLPSLPQRIECFDVSHSLGEATVASCVVFDAEGPLKPDYRRFNIKNIQKGDDYAALNQALSRRYTRLKEGEGLLPDILLIDGGKGQLAEAIAVLEELQVSGVLLIGIAKGPERKPGLETLFIVGREHPIHLSPDSTALHLLQQIRDEAHRFAITGHRKQRAKARSQSPLEDISGIGAKRRRELLRQFGGLQEIKRASVEDIAKVPGINRELAQRIYDNLHGE